MLVRCRHCGRSNSPEARYCANCGRPLENTLSPGVISSYANGWNQLWKHFLELFLIGVIYFAISFVLWILQWVVFFSLNSDLTSSGYYAVFSTVIAYIYSWLVLLPLGFGLAWAFLKAARGDNVEITDMFNGFKNYKGAVLAGFLLSLVVIVIDGILLLYGSYVKDHASAITSVFSALISCASVLIIVIYYCKMAFVPFLVVDKKLGGLQALKESWRLTGGHAWQVFLIGLLAVPIIIAGFICFFFGVIISIMWIYMALASLYHAISASRPAQGASSSVASPPSTA